MSEKKKASEVLKWIEDRIAEGRTVNISTAWKVIQISPKTYKKWQDSEHKLFKLSNNDDDLYIARGKNWDCIWNKGFGCRFTAR